MDFNIELVAKVGSMGLINKEYRDIDYNILAHLCRELKPGYVFVTSGATEIGRLDYINRTGFELTGDDEDNKTDYASQGQSILMQNYRTYIDSRYSVRQFLVEHHHFNDEKKVLHLKNALLRCSLQGAIPIINYNDPVSDEENRKMEIQLLKEKHQKVVECVDNDETASQIACLLKPKYLLLLTSVDGIFSDVKDPSSLIKEIKGKTTEELLAKVEYYQHFCDGASRKGANGARAKLEYIKEPLKVGTTVIISNSKFGIKAALDGTCPRTLITLEK